MKKKIKSEREEIYALDELHQMNQIDGDKELIFVEQIEKYCLSKQRVKEAIGKHGVCNPSSCIFVQAPRGNCCKEILKELGLDMELKE